MLIINPLITKLSATEYAKMDTEKHLWSGEEAVC